MFHIWPFPHDALIPTNNGSNMQDEAGVDSFRTFTVTCPPQP